MNSNIVLSIIVPVYKVQDFLDDCVRSIVNQMLDTVELILVDDGSPDDCPQICDRWASKYNSITVIHKMNGGLSDARNAGIMSAKGIYVWFVDSDDWIGETAIHDILASIKHCVNIDLIAMQLVEVKNGKQQIYGDYPDFPVNPMIITNQKYVESNFPVLPSVRYIIRRNILMESNLLFIKGVLHEDIPFCHMLIYKAKRISFLKKPTYFYRIREGSITTAPKIESCYSLVKNYKSIKQFSEENEIKDEEKWFVLLKYDYFHEIFIRLYPFIGKKEYKDFMSANYTFIKKEFVKLYSFLPLKRKVLLISFMLSPRLFSFLLFYKKK